MNQLLLSLIAATIGFAANANEPANASTDAPLYWMRVSAKNAKERTAIANTGVAIEVVNKDDVVVLGTASELAVLQKKNKIQTFFKINALDFPTNDSNFHNYAELKAALELLAKNHPDIVTLGTIGKSMEKRDIFVLSIGENRNDPSTAAAFFVGGHHAREHLSVEMPLMLAQGLAEKYAAGDAEGGDLFRQDGLLVIHLQALQRGDHFLATSQRRATGVGTEFALAADPGHDHARQHAEDHLRNKSSDEKSYPLPAFVSQQHAIHEESDHA